MPGADIGTKRALGGRLRSAAEVEDGAGKLFRSFLWRIVPDVFEYAALVVAGKETLVSLRFLRRVHLVIGAMNYNRRDADLGQGCQLRLDGCIARIACGITNAMSVGVDHYVQTRLLPLIVSSAATAFRCRWEKLTYFGLPPNTSLVTLSKRLVCKECGAKSVQTFRYVPKPLDGSGP